MVIGQSPPGKPFSSIVGGRRISAPTDPILFSDFSRGWNNGRLELRDWLDDGAPLSRVLAEADGFFSGLWLRWIAEGKVADGFLS